MRRRNCAWILPSLGFTVWIGSALTMAGPSTKPAPAAVVQQLMHKELTAVPGKELEMLTVEYPPGGASPPHSHHAQVLVYVLSGTLRMQVQGSPVVTLQPGQTFYEGVDDVHSVSENASTSEPAKFLVFMVKDASAAEPPQATGGNIP
jgi:quercetin dioxygenase-like cupin family protein